MPSVTVDSTYIPAVAASSRINSIKLTLTPEEASMLRRVCYYNLTVADKFAGNPNGGHRKSYAVKSFMNSLGNSLKAKGIDRF